MSQTLWPEIREYLTTEAPPPRRSGTLSNTVTTVDLKLTYNASLDQLVPVIIEVNATPAAIAEAHNRLTEQDVITPAVAAFTSNLQESNTSLLLFYSDDAYSDKNKTWSNNCRIGRDRAALAEAIAAKPTVTTVTHTADPDRVSVSAGKIYIGGDRVDGYVNFHEDGDMLLDVFKNDIIALSQGANAPTGCWATSIDLTGKWGIMNCARRLLNVLDTAQVRVPKFTRANTVSAVAQFREKLGQAAIIKAPYGSWGQEVVAISPSSDIRDSIAENSRLKLNRSTTREDNNQQIGSLAVDSSREQSEYLLAEEAIVPTDSSDNIFAIPPEAHPASTSSPIDLTVLACRSDPADDRGVETPSKLVRLSGDPNWNLHSGEADDTIVSIERAYDGPVTVKQSTGETFEVNIPHLLNKMAGRPVTKSELQRVIQKAGECGLGARNLAGFIAESHLGSYLE